MSLKNNVNSLLLRAYSVAADHFGPHKPRARQLYRAFYFTYKRFLEDDLKLLLDTHPALVRGGHVFDIGANIGYTASVFSRYIDAKRKVFAFEPELANFETLEGTIARHKLSNVESYRLAIGEETADVRLAINRINPGDHRIFQDTEVSSREFQQIKMTTIDEFSAARLAGEAISFIKVDVQGYEFSVCKGMSQTVHSNPELKIFLEFSPTDLVLAGASALRLTEWLSERGFLGFRVNRSGCLLPVVLSEIGKETRYMNILFSRQAL